MSNQPGSSDVAAPSEKEASASAVPTVDTREEDELEEQQDKSTEGLLSHKKKRFSLRRQRRRRDWMRPYWLGTSLFLVLFSFWLLDSLKDPVFAMLVDGKLDKHQPPAKLCSVASTLALVCLLEFLSHQRKKQQLRRSKDDILNPGGRWTRMNMDRSEDEETDDAVPVSTFTYVGVSYICVFLLLAFLLRFHPGETTGDASWHVLGYVLYATIESFGSLSVAAFWSYTNSTLSLQDAERFYGLIIAIAQLGAIFGSSMVTMQFWSTITLMLLVCLVIVLQILVMNTYARRFPPTATTSTTTTTPTAGEEPLLSGVYLILRHNYVLLILGVSCLYEVSLTCLDYQMKVLGWYRFEDYGKESMSFTQFMGHYGQLVNVTSLVFSYFIFPCLISKYGLRYTLRLFPTLLLLVTVVAYRAMPGNLAVLFVSLSILKAMTYSIHDPSKELLYIPTSNSIKFRSKFWIDVVGARVAKAIGSSINTYAKSVDQSVRVGTIPSLVTAVALWFVCFRVGNQFDKLVEDGTIVGTTAGEQHAPKVEYTELATLRDDHVEDGEVGLAMDDEHEESETLLPDR